MNEEAAGKAGSGGKSSRGSEINEMTQLQYWKDKPDACWHGGMKQIWRHRRASSLKLRRLRLWRTCAWKYRRYDYGMSVEEKEKRGEKEKKRERKSMRLRRKKRSGVQDWPRWDQMELLHILPPSPCLLRDRNYPLKFKWLSILVEYNFNHIDDRILILLSFSLSHWFVCLLNFQPYFCDICMYIF